MMREAPVRDTDPDPYSDMAAPANQDDDRFSPVAFTVDFGSSLGSNSEEKSKKLERFALRSSQRKVLSPSPGSTARPSSASRTRQKDRSVSANRQRYRGEEIKFSLLDNKVRHEDDDSYQNDTFESDSDDNHAGRENVPDKADSNPSETGTYTVDKDDDSPASPQTQESRLESLMEKTKSSYVEEWATKHAMFPMTSPMSLSPDERKSSVSSTRSSNRRMLPRPPSRDKDTELFSPESEQGSSLTPPRTQESEAEDEFSFMEHTQHLVDVMEERLKQKTLKKLEAKSTRSSVPRNFCSAKPEAKSVASKASVKVTKSSGKSNMKSPEPTQDALEAWKRRKNYDPLAAAGRKKSAGLSRKLSAGSSMSGVMSPPQDDTSESESLRERPRPASRPSLASRQSASAPGSAKSRSSGSSGYISRGTERLRRTEAVERPSSSATPVTRAVTAPLRRLAHTNSSSPIKPKQSSSRSSSSLTSKEAEFQAWKRRKNYDPMKAASKSSSSKAKESRKVSTESCRSYSSSTTTTVEPAREAPRHRRLVDMSSREMTKSLVMEELSMDTPMQRSNSFHCNAKKNGRIQSEDESEDEFGSGYESSLADSQIRSYPHFYLDDDELIMPIQSSHSRISGHRSLMSSSRLAQSQVSPSKSRSKLEALDTLVISTIHNVSNKLCSSSAGVLRQAAAVFPDQDEEQASTLETVIYLLEDMDLPPSPAKKTSRELSGTLRNLKKIEQAMEMMKKLMDSQEILED